MLVSSSQSPALSSHLDHRGDKPALRRSHMQCSTHTFAYTRLFPVLHMYRHQRALSHAHKHTIRRLAM